MTVGELRKALEGFDQNSVALFQEPSGSTWQLASVLIDMDDGFWGGKTKEAAVIMGVTVQTFEEITDRIADSIDSL